MVTAMQIVGAERAGKLARELKEMGDKELRKELGKAFSRAMRKPREAARARARRDLPHRGGLAELVASSKITVKNRLAGRNPSLTLVAANPYNVRAINAGKVRHPVFGRNVWVNQAVTPGWWSNPMKENEPEARREIAAALDEIQRKLDDKR